MYANEHKTFMMHLRLPNSDDDADYDHRAGTGMKSCKDAGNSLGTPFRSACTERGAYSG